MRTTTRCWQFRTTEGTRSHDLIDLAHLNGKRICFDRQLFLSSNRLGHDHSRTCNNTRESDVMVSPENDDLRGLRDLNAADLNERGLSQCCIRNLPVVTAIGVQSSVFLFFIANRLMHQSIIPFDLPQACEYFRFMLFGRRFFDGEHDLGSNYRRTNRTNS